MKTEEIYKRYENITDDNFLFDAFLNDLKETKKIYVKENNQQSAKEIWCYETILHIHQEFRAVHKLLLDKEYYKAWCLLAQIEIIFSGLKRHFIYNRTDFYMWQIEKAVQNLQIIFPYRLFASSEILKKKVVCDICSQEVSIRKDCGHRLLEIYDGVMCTRTITKSELLGISLVENPANKYSVMFIVDPETGKQTDQYSYDVVDYLMENINSPYKYWDIDVQKRYEKVDKKIGRNSNCPCNKGKKYKNCCINKPGLEYTHFEFILEKPSDKVFYSNTLKKKAQNES